MKGMMNHCIVINLHFENNVENRICHCVELEIVKTVNFSSFSSVEFYCNIDI